ncbi:MAG: DegT/DnrJ/EryC1/StrS family aminotransferase [Thaumarchaeota archaeon]|nr:DegT/DnrJ/EryC1/StrS family aminotransferase [Nitrososphaerota archaeon]
MLPPWPHATEKDRRALLEVLDSGQWCRVGAGKGGWSRVDAFDGEFAKFQDAKHGVSVANGTVALELALRAMGIGSGDEVIVPALTFIASATCATEVGAVPILVDCDHDTGTVSASSIEEAITERTRAVVLPAYHGYPPDFDAILPIARKNNLKVLEDAATGVGTEWKGRRIGAMGDMGTFSFQQAKLITSGEGGIVLTNDDKLAETARLIQNIGRVHGPLVNDFLITSSNYRMTEFQGALLLSMLEDLPPQLELKRRNGEYLADQVEKIDGIKTQKRDPRVKFSRYKFIMRYDQTAFGGITKERFIEALRAEGVGVDERAAKLIYRQTAFATGALGTTLPKGLKLPDYAGMFLPNSEALLKEEIMLGHTYMAVDKSGLDMIVASIEKIKTNVDELKVAPSIKR